MNKQRKKHISNVVDHLNFQREVLKNIYTDEEYYFDNMPENLQVSYRGEQSEEAIQALAEAIDSLDITIDNLEMIV